jgi:hypothetical protein
VSGTRELLASVAIIYARIARVSQDSPRSRNRSMLARTMHRGTPCRECRNSIAADSAALRPIAEEVRGKLARVLERLP